MSSPSKESEEPSSSTDALASAATAADAPAGSPRPPAKRPLSHAVIEISDTESDDSDICAVTSYQATADEVKRIRGADYSSSSSSSSDYSSDSDSPCEDDSIVVDDTRSTKVPKAQLNPRANRMDNPKFNPALKTQDLIEKLKTHWKEQKDYITKEVTFTTEPFRVCLLHDLLGNAEIINNMVDDMNTLDWTRKKMDLFEFHQTADLASLTWQRGIKGIYELLKTEVMSWVSQVTGLSLTSISASCSLYGPGDHLLVHDDRLEDRRVAFILYLAPWTPRSTALLNGGADHVDVDDVEQESCGWSRRMGGALELFGRDGAGRPDQVVKEIFPRNNMMALFKVGVDSFHQVGEVLSLELPRLSINGWFHGPAGGAGTDGGAEPDPLPPPEDTKLHNEVVLLSQWVQSEYMSPRNRAQIQAQVERESEASLHHFVADSKLDLLLGALRAPEVPWEDVGPANHRRYQALPAGWVGSLDAEHPLRAALQLWGSAAFGRLLADCTDLQLTACARLELQRWRTGDYILLPPPSHYSSPRLETTLYLSPPSPLRGGSTTYVSPEEEGEGALVTVPPTHNCLSLVYCDAGAVAFTQRLSRLTMRPDQCYYVLACTYKE